GLEANMLFMDLDRWSEPVSMVSERYRDFPTYNSMIYSKAQLFYEQLRYVVGDDAMRRILRTYYARWQLKHVDEAKFRAVCEEVSGQDLGWLFGQWLHGTVLIDYRLDKVKRSRLSDGRGRTGVTIRRRGDGRRRDASRRLLLPLGESRRPPRAAHRDQRRGVERRGPHGGRPARRPLAAPHAGATQRPARGVRRAVDGDHRHRLRGPAP